MTTDDVLSGRGQRNPNAPGVASNPRGRATDGVVDDGRPLTRAQMRKLDRRVKDLDDRTRYLLVSTFSHRFALYYNVSDDTYGMNEPTHATLFKRRAAAHAIRQMLGGRIAIAQCGVDGRGRLVLNSLPVRRRLPARPANERGRR